MCVLVYSEVIPLGLKWYNLYLGSGCTTVPTSTEASLSGRTGHHPRYVVMVVYSIE